MSILNFIEKIKSNDKNDNLNINNFWNDNNDNIKIIKNWIKNFNNEKKKILLIYSKLSVDKNSFIEIIINDLNLNKTILNVEEIKTLDYMTNNFSSNVIIIKNIDLLSFNSEKNKLFDLCKSNNKIPIILTWNIKHTKIIVNIKKNCKEIILKNFNNKELIEKIKLFICQEKINIDENFIIYDKIIKFCKNNLQFIKITLINLKNFYNNNSIDSNKFNDYLKYFLPVKYNVELFQSTKKI